MERGECPVTIFCDLSRAFDCVNLEKLLVILEKYGIRGAPLTWVSTFLKGRKQYVSVRSKNSNCVQEVNSTLTNTTMGVPQGSVLGPVLFILYLNSVYIEALNTKFLAYADDISIIVTGKNSEEIQNNGNEILKKVSSYFKDHDLCFNAKKTDLLRFHNHQKDCEMITLNINNSSIKTSHNSVKFLGVHVDELLGWKAHCEQLISKMGSLAFLFRNLRNILNQQQLVNLYHGYVESRLRYGICLWGHSTSSQSVFIAQKRVLRCLSNIPKRYSCRNIFVKHKILTLTGILIYELGLYIFTYRNNFKIVSNNHTINTRQKNNFHIPFARLKITSNSPHILGLKIFNHLPQHLKIIDNLYIFKKTLKQFLVEGCFYSLNEFFLLNKL